MVKWEKLTRYLQSQNVSNGKTISVSIDKLIEIVGKIGERTNRRVSYWDAYMGRQTLNPGAAAAKAGFVVTAFEWEIDSLGPKIITIRLQRYK